MGAACGSFGLQIQLAQLDMQKESDARAREAQRQLYNQELEKMSRDYWRKVMGDGRFTRDLKLLAARSAPAQPVGYEGAGAKPTDLNPAPSPKEIAASIKELDRRVRAAEGGRTVSNAIVALDTQWKSDGRPHAYELD